MLRGCTGATSESFESQRSQWQVPEWPEIYSWGTNKKASGNFFAAGESTEQRADIRFG